MTTIECDICQLKYFVYDQNIYICKCNNIFAQVQCKGCGKQSAIFFDEMEAFTKVFRCNECQYESILSPCGNCKEIDLRKKDCSQYKCLHCDTLNYYSKCQLCAIISAVPQMKGESIDGKLIRCPLNCGDMIAFNCSNCNTLVQVENQKNEMKHYCSSCKKYFYKQICDQCKFITVVTEKQYNQKLKFKCANKKCNTAGMLKNIKIENLPFIEGKLIHPKEIQPLPKEKESTNQETFNSKFFQQTEQLDILNMEPSKVVTETNSNKLIQQSEEIDILNMPDQQSLQHETPYCGNKVPTCKSCNTSTDCLITVPCYHKVCCYNCLSNISNCLECNSVISNRILNTFNRNFDQEIIERIKSERSK